MGFFDRLGKGWKLGLTSLRIIQENKNLLVFPVFSFIALLFIALTFFGGFVLISGAGLESWLDNLSEESEVLAYAGLFIYYLINYFVVVFFNLALVHCARLIFEEKEATIADGLQYSVSRIGAIFSWALLAATVGVILKTIQQRAGAIGQIIIGIIGMVWSIATFFVVPVIAYENVGPIEAVKRSGQIMKDKWGEAIGASFSFGLFYILGYLVIIVAAILLFSVHFALGIVAALLSILFLHTVVAAAKTVFIAATYNHLNNQPAGQFEDGVLDDLFVPKD